MPLLTLPVEAAVLWSSTGFLYIFISSPSNASSWTQMSFSRLFFYKGPTQSKETEKERKITEEPAQPSLDTV